MARLLKIGIAGLFLVFVLELAARNLFFPQYTAMLPDMYPHPSLAISTSGPDGAAHPDELRRDQPHQRA